MSFAKNAGHLTKIRRVPMGNLIGPQHGTLSNVTDPKIIKNVHSCIPLGKCEYLRLPMGLCNSPDIFQERIDVLMDNLEFARTCLDDLLIITTGSCEQQPRTFRKSLNQTRCKWLKNVHVKKQIVCR